jgi:thiol-disulfide isomerase/thioredoxin
MRRLPMATLALLVLTTTALAQAPAAPRTPIPDDTPDAFGAKVRAYLLAHPEVIMEAVQILQQRQQAARADLVKGVIAARARELFHDPAAPEGGNPAGDVTLVEFFDYDCPYCRSVAPTLVELRGADPGLRLVYKEFPILGPGSEAAARAALAVDRKGLPVVEAFYAELGLKALPIYLDATAQASRELEAPGIPTTLLLDHQGREIGRALGERNWDSEEVMEEIERLLGRELQQSRPESVAGQ